MKRWLVHLLSVLVLWLAFPSRCPAPWTYTPGEGWRYETAGTEGKWVRKTAREQMEVAQAAFDKKDYKTALLASRRVVSHPSWRFGDYAGPAQYLVGRSHEALKQDLDAFEAYQKLLEKYPKVENYEEVVKRQFIIANRFLDGQRFPFTLFNYRVFGYMGCYRSMDKTITLYDQIIKNGPFNEVAPLAQMNIGLAHERKKGFLVSDPENLDNAAKAYKKAAERYAEQKIGVDALFREAQTYTRQARRAEYDQSIAGRAIATYTDFMALHPDDTRVAEAQKTIESLRTEQARGSFEVARFYEKRHRWQGALIYYNEVLLKDPESRYASTARERIAAIQKRISG